MKAAVFVSGSGTNLEALLEREKAGDLQVEIAGVISDKPDAYALTRAKKPRRGIRGFHPERIWKQRGL